MLKRAPGPRMLALLAAVAALLTACTTLGPDLVAPRLSLVGVQMLSTDMFAQKFKLRVLVENPNDLELPVRGLEYQIIMMGDSFADGTSNDVFLLPARGEAEFDMLVTTNFVSSFGRLISRVGAASSRTSSTRSPARSTWTRACCAGSHSATAARWTSRAR